MPQDSDDIVLINWPNKEKPGWYEFRFTHDTSQQWVVFLEKYKTIVSWITDNVEMPVRHARWYIDDGLIFVRFRYERDYIRFILRWS